MTVIKRGTIPVIVALAGVKVVWAAVGCLTEVEQLVPRADVILIGRIQSVSTTRLQECPSTLPVDGHFYGGYLRCGDINEAVVTVENQLKGQVDKELLVLIAAESVLSMTCDDRPPVEQMAGLHALLFLERFGGRLWTVDGPNSVHASRTPVPQHGRYIQRVKRLLDASIKNEHE